MLKRLSLPLKIAAAALIISIISQFAVEMLIVGRGGGWDDLDKAIWVTVLVTVPAFSIAAACGLYAAFVWLKSLRKVKRK